MGVADVSQQVKTIVEEARKQLEKVQAYQKKYYDAYHRHQEFQVGDMVLLSTKNFHLPGTRKLHPRWVGPFKVFQHIGPTAYRLTCRGDSAPSIPPSTPVISSPINQVDLQEHHLNLWSWMASWSMRSRLSRLTGSKAGSWNS